MAARHGVNGASAATLTARFIKCPGCNVNIPREDLVALGRCTVCQRPYEVGGGGDDDDEHNHGDDGSRPLPPPPPPAAKPKMKRWVEMTSKRGRVYYHNTETGEDVWERPPDMGADAIEDGFVPFKNDAVKNAVLREQAKLDATKMGVPLDVIASLQQRQQQQAGQADDPFTKMLERPVSKAPAPAPCDEATGAAPQSNTKAASSARREATRQTVGEDKKENDEAARSCVVM